MTTPLAACFDLDGTLFDHVGAAREGAAAFLERQGAESTEAALSSWFAAEEEQFERWRLGEVSFPEQRRQRLRTVLPPLGCVVPADDAGSTRCSRTTSARTGLRGGCSIRRDTRRPDRPRDAGPGGRQCPRVLDHGLQG